MEAVITENTDYCLPHRQPLSNNVFDLFSVAWHVTMETVREFLWSCLYVLLAFLRWLFQARSASPEQIWLDEVIISQGRAKLSIDSHSGESHWLTLLHHRFFSRSLQMTASRRVPPCRASSKTHLTAGHPSVSLGCKISAVTWEERVIILSINNKLVCKVLFARHKWLPRLLDMDRKKNPPMETHSLIYLLSFCFTPGLCPLIILLDETCCLSSTELWLLCVVLTCLARMSQPPVSARVRNAY